MMDLSKMMMQMIYGGRRSDKSGVNEDMRPNVPFHKGSDIHSNSRLIRRLESLIGNPYSMDVCNTSHYYVRI